MADTQVNPSAESLIGTTVGDYKIIDIIGQGGMGTVYTAEHQQLHHLTACKVLRAEVANHPETVERFLQEARLISRIRNTNLIDIFDIGELPDKRLYYVMEYLNGRTLAQALHDQRMPFAGIVAIMGQICSGLHAAHAAGLVHRDLKPDNLFLVERPGEPPLVKIVDFGVAKVMDLGSTEAKSQPGLPSAAQSSKSSASNAVPGFTSSVAMTWSPTSSSGTGAKSRYQRPTLPMASGTVTVMTSSASSRSSVTASAEETGAATMTRVAPCARAERTAARSDRPVARPSSTRIAVRPSIDVAGRPPRWHAAQPVCTCAPRSGNPVRS